MAFLGRAEKSARFSCHDPEAVVLVAGCHGHGVIASRDLNEVAVFDLVDLIDISLRAVNGLEAEALRLIKVTEMSFYEAMKVAKAGNRVGDIGHAIESFVISNGFSVVKEYTGHGVGAAIHEDPSVPNYGNPGRGPRLYSGMTLAIEPMVNVGFPNVKVLKDGWTVVTADGSLSAHYENSIAITDGDPILLTDAEN